MRVRHSHVVPRDDPTGNDDAIVMSNALVLFAACTTAHITYQGRQTK